MALLSNQWQVANHSPTKWFERTGAKKYPLPAFKTAKSLSKANIHLQSGLRQPERKWRPLPTHKPTKIALLSHHSPTNGFERTRAKVKTLTHPQTNQNYPFKPPITHKKLKRTRAKKKYPCPPSKQPKVTLKSHHSAALLSMIFKFVRISKNWIPS